jgi:hypothetical protein
MEKCQGRGKKCRGVTDSLSRGGVLRREKRGNFGKNKEIQEKMGKKLVNKWKLTAKMREN